MLRMLRIEDDGGLAARPSALILPVGYLLLLVQYLFDQDETF
jgi:hypothetical protein